MASIRHQSEERTEAKQSDVFAYLLGPNPANKFIQLSIEDKVRPEPSEILILDVFGRVLKTVRNHHSGVLTIDLANIPSGLYQVFCQDLGLNKRFVITR